MTSTHLRRSLAFIASAGLLGAAFTAGVVVAQNSKKPAKPAPYIPNPEDFGKPVQVPTVNMDGFGKEVPKVPTLKADPTFMAIRKAEQDAYKKVRMTPVPTEDLQEELKRRFEGAETAAAEIQKSITIPPPASAGAGGSIEIKPYVIPATIDPAAFPTVDPSTIDPKRGVAKPLGAGMKKIAPAKPDSKPNTKPN